MWETYTAPPAHRLKCTASVHESLESILNIPIFSTLIFFHLLIRSIKNSINEILKSLDFQQDPIKI